MVSLVLVVTSFVVASLSYSEAFSQISPKNHVTHHVRCCPGNKIQRFAPELSSSDISYNFGKRSMSTALQMLPVHTGFFSISHAITGGVVAGSLHAIAGPDHLAALLPRCSGKRWYIAGKIGAFWGVGHGISATIVGLVAFFLKSRMSGQITNALTGVSSVMDFAVGLSLVGIGVIGLKEAFEWEAQLHEVRPKSLSAAANEVVGVKGKRNRSVIFNGLLHGFSWDGMPSLAPAIAVSSWRGNLTFLLSYAMGTIAAMAATTTLIGEGTRKASEVFERPNIPQQFSFVSSIIAIIIGCVWVYLAAM